MKKTLLIFCFTLITPLATLVIRVDTAQAHRRCRKALGGKICIPHQHKFKSIYVKNTCDKKISGDVHYKVKDTSYTALFNISPGVTDFAADTDINIYEVTTYNRSDFDYKKRTVRIKPNKEKSVFKITC